ncbi:MAG TPA: hypothetical protein VM532_01920 [Burkholderiales bacterium]|nr:hypothetical protein [Burkholderiales bacterium]
MSALPAQEDIPQSNSVTSPSPRTPKQSAESPLHAAVSGQKHDNLLLGETLVDLGILERSDLMAVLSIQNNASDPVEALSLVSGIRSRLGEILLQTSCISSHQLEHALELQKESGERLGEMLIGLGWLTRNDLDTALAIQQHKENMAKTGRRFRLGEILVATSQISRQQLQDALTKQKLTGRKLGHILVDDGYVGPEQVNRALQLQNRFLAE